MLVVCEDDATFKMPRESIDAIVDEFFQNSDLSVLCLGNNPTHIIPISERLGISADVQTTSCYVVKAGAVDAVLAAAHRSARMLRVGVRDNKAAIDVVWKTAQQKNFFAVPLERAVEQLASYSDIELAHRRYGV
jgi:glycosyl transferase family 25